MSSPCYFNEYNREGYFNPIVDKDSCINCGICETHCPVLHPTAKNQDPIKAYASWINDEKIRSGSSSGGIFSALAQNVLSQGGVVWGVGYSADMRPVYKCIDKTEALPLLWGSKYVQCQIENCFKDIREELKSNRKVLFCGTPCHVAGLYSFLGDISLEHLTTIDFVCHGVPSPLLFNNYIKWLERRYKDKVIDYKFRDSKFGINYNIGTSVVFKGKGKKYLYLTDNSYVLGFCGNKTIHGTCSSCKFDGLQRCSDFTIGDFHGAKGEYSPSEQFLGISCVIANNKKAEKTLKETDVYIKEIPIEKIIKSNPNYTSHKRFDTTLDLQEITNNDFEIVQKRYFKPSIRDIAKCFTLRLLGGKISYMIKNII